MFSSWGPRALYIYIPFMDSISDHLSSYTHIYMPVLRCPNWAPCAEYKREGDEILLMLRDRRRTVSKSDIVGMFHNTFWPW